MAYKILRLIEYTYPDEFTADQDMMKWQVAAIGSEEFKKGNIIRSTIIQYPERNDDGNLRSPTV